MKQKNQGFTIVELIIVIVVMGVIAAISIAGYGAWRSSLGAKQATSDLKGFQSAMESAKNFGAGYPTYTAGTIFDGKAGSFDNGKDPSKLFKSSNGITVTYRWGTDKVYCIEAVSNTASSITYYLDVSRGDKTPKQGTCGVYVANQGGVSTIVSGGLSQPSGIAVTPDGSVIYVAETYNNRILKITQSGTITLLAGTGAAGFADGVGTSAIFNQPHGLTLDAAGNLYVVDTLNSKLRKINTSTSVVSTVAGSSPGTNDGDGTSSGAKFYDPYAIATDPSNGDLYITDTHVYTVRKVVVGTSQSNTVVSTVAGGTKGTQDGTGSSVQFNDPLGIVVGNSGLIYIGEYSNNRIRSLTKSGVSATLAGADAGFADGVGTNALFNQPTGLGILNNVLFISDGANNRVRMMDLSNMQVSTLAGSSIAGGSDGPTDATFNQPNGIAVDQNGVVYIVEGNAGRIRKIQ